MEMTLDLPEAQNRAATARDAFAVPLGLRASAQGQTTLAKTVSLRGIGLHTGQTIALHLHPAGDSTGLRFFRSDLKNGARDIQVRAHNVTNTQLCTQLSNDHGGCVSTIEHLMAALHALGIHNAVIEVSGPEVPIFDGSSAVFIDAIVDAGLQTSDARARALRIIQPMEARNDLAVATLLPSQELTLDLEVSIDFSASCIGQQAARLRLTPEGFQAEISAARTFGFVEDLEVLRAQGRALGGSIDTAVVIKDNAIQNPEGLRYCNEFARHKLLDAVGDLYIEGLPVLGKFVGHRCGHRVTNQLMRNVIEQPDCFEIIDL